MIIKLHISLDSSFTDFNNIVAFWPLSIAKHMIISSI